MSQIIKLTPASVPVDIFIEICSYLNPTDLISLMGVCNQIRNWLSSTTSSSTQDIWRTSRLKFLPDLQLPPFSDMDELSYIKLGLIENGCQFCGRKKDPCKVFWVFRVSHRDLPSGAIFPVDVPNCLPYMKKGSEYDFSRMYWRQDVNSTCEELKALYNSTPEEQAEWFKKKRESAYKIMEDWRKRISDERHWLLCRRREDKKQFEKIIHELKEEQRDDGSPKYVDRWIWELRSCGDAFQLSREPFINKNWIKLKNAMIDEYEELMKQQRQQQICQCILSLLSAYGMDLSTITLHQRILASTAGLTELEILKHRISVSDSIIECLRWCPSYQNPPFINNDPRNPWNINFLLNDLIPQLHLEAEELSKKPGPIRSGLITTVMGAINQGCSKCEIFRFVKVLVEEMVSVNRERVVDCVQMIFPFDGSASESFQHFRHWHATWS
ncbi:2332_t:CDS:2 [Diversispora eburnea]|uniref:2332_t:CDS:1 n=1 Tax=Diversispora eburnea TaxID=1213867 RepID=A0A9N8V3W6_9GLOM|nr:2332_t:CDS:2 [Diversispora eburnea]